MPLELPFGIALYLDTSFWEVVLTWPTPQLISAIMAIVGWAFLVIVFFFMGAELWVAFRNGKYTSKWKWILLAVDVPAEMIQSPKAVEQIFAHFSGALAGINVGQKYWLGKKQKWFSMELISIEGYIQFLIYTEAEFRDLVEAAIYAQYPMAEITEVEDYTSALPDRFPNENYDMFGLEFGLAQEDAFPIRVYPDFEHSVTKDFMFNDPMAGILENFTRIGPGENLWMQIILEPTSNAWKEKGITLIKKIIEQKKDVKGGGIVSFVGSLPALAAQELIRAWEGNYESAEVVKKEPLPGKVADLPPGTKNTLQAIEEKISKIGFKSKIRAIYIARKEVFSPNKCVDGLVGAMNQFHNISRNALVGKLATLAFYAFKNWRILELKNRLMKGYKKRKIKVGGSPYILNIEELATLWHFPLPLVKTPLLQKSMSKRSEPPIDLPVERLESALSPLNIKKPEQSSVEKDEYNDEDPLLYG